MSHTSDSHLLSDALLRGCYAKVTVTFIKLLAYCEREFLIYTIDSRLRCKVGKHVESKTLQTATRMFNRL